MARAGLGSGWSCLYANDFDAMKVAAYQANWGRGDIHHCDINDVTTADLPGEAALAWASFPCQDLSLAGNYAGIGAPEDAAQTRSGTFWAFWRLMLGLQQEGRAPDLIVLENVYGILTAKGGRNFAAIGDCFALAGYRFGAMLVDAARFVPQSRPRVFIIGVKNGRPIPSSACSDGPEPMWHPKALVKAFEGLSSAARASWIWWHMPSPSAPRAKLETVVGDDPAGVSWHSEGETARLISLMSDRNLEKLRQLKARGDRAVATVYRRTRLGKQCAELRADGLAGCLRTPAGGSSRQFVVIVQGEKVRSRLLSAKEAGRLMGLPSRYKLPSKYNDAYHLAGDGVAVPVVRHIARSLLQPLWEAEERHEFAVAAE